MGAEGRRTARGAAGVAALGVVFGDIGTSSIYTIQTAFDPGEPHPVQASLVSVYGLVSLIFWAVTLIVTVKYVLFVFSADDDGEGEGLTTYRPATGVPVLTYLARELAAGRRGKQ